MSSTNLIERLISNVTLVSLGEDKEGLPPDIFPPQAELSKLLLGDTCSHDVAYQVVRGHGGLPNLLIPVKK